MPRPNFAIAVDQIVRYEVFFDQKTIIAPKFLIGVKSRFVDHGSVQGRCSSLVNLFCDHIQRDLVGVLDPAVPSSEQRALFYFEIDYPLEQLAIGMVTKTKGRRLRGEILGAVSDHFFRMANADLVPVRIAGTGIHRVHRIRVIRKIGR